MLLYHFTDANPNAVASDFTAVVNWGDGSTSTVTGPPSSGVVDYIVADGGGFDVYGSHLYGKPEADATFSVTVSDAGGASCSASQTPFNVADNPIVAGALTPPPLGGTSFNWVPLFTFTDADYPAPNFSALVSWGDGTTTLLTETNDYSSTSPILLQSVQKNPYADVFVVYGSHTYQGPLNDATFSVQVTDQYGTTVVASTNTFSVTTAFYWDANGVSSPAAGGSGTWGSGADWRVGSPTGPLSAWVNGADAIFPAGTGTVTIAGPITANSLDFEGNGAIVQSSGSGASLALVSNAAASMPSGVSVAAGTAIVNSVLGSSASLAVSGGGALTLRRFGHLRRDRGRPRQHAEYCQQRHARRLRRLHAHEPRHAYQQRRV